MVSKSMLRAPGSLTSGEIEPVRFSGPMAPATQRGLSGVRRVISSAAWRASPRGGDVELVGELLHLVVGQRDDLRVEGVRLDDVGAGLEVLEVDGADDVRLGQRQQVVVALHVGVPVGETLPAVPRLVRPVPLDRRSHGPVQDQDAFPHRGREVVGGVWAYECGIRQGLILRVDSAYWRACELAATRRRAAGLKSFGVPILSSPLPPPPANPVPPGRARRLEP